MKVWLRRCSELAIVAVVCAGCGNSPQRPDTPAPTSQDTLDQYREALVMLESERYTDAELALLKIAVEFPDYAGPYFNLGLVYQRTERPEKAEEAYQESLARNPNLAAAHNQLGILYRQQGRFAEAAEAYSKATALVPDYAIAYLNHGVLLDLYLQQPLEALRMYEQYRTLVTADSGQPTPVVDRWIIELSRRIEHRKTAQVQP